MTTITLPERGTLPLATVITPYSLNSIGAELAALGVATPASTTWPAAFRVALVPVKFDVASNLMQAAVHNGATVGGSWDVGLYDTLGTRLYSSGLVSQSGVNTVQVLRTIVPSSDQTIESTTNATSYASLSWTPTTSRLYVVFVTNTKATTADTPTISGNSMTWTQYATVTQDSGTTKARLTVFYAFSTAPTAGATTVDFAGVTQTGCMARFIACTNTSATSGNNGSDGLGTFASSTGTTGASGDGQSVGLTDVPTTDSSVLGVIATVDDSPALTLGTDFASVGTLVIATPIADQTTLRLTTNTGLIPAGINVSSSVAVGTPYIIGGVRIKANTTNVVISPGDYFMALGATSTTTFVGSAALTTITGVWKNIGVRDSSMPSTGLPASLGASSARSSAVAGIIPMFGFSVYPLV